MSLTQLVDKLAEIGVVDSEPNIRDKLGQGKFTTVFLAMFRGNRGKILAAFLICIAGACLAFYALFYGLSEQRRYTQVANDSAAEYLAHSAYQEQQACRAVARSKLAECRRDAKSEYAQRRYDKRRDYDDLVAQQRSALWTSITGIAAITGMMLSAVGVALVYTTFRETKLGNKIARDSVRGYLAPIIEADWKDNAGNKDPIISVINIGTADCLLTSFNWIWNDELPSKEESLVLIGPPRVEPVCAGKTVELGSVKGKRPYGVTEYLIGVFRYRTMLNTDQRTYFVYRVIDGIAIDAKPEDWFKDT